MVKSSPKESKEKKSIKSDKKESPKNKKGSKSQVQQQEQDVVTEQPLKLRKSQGTVSLLLSYSFVNYRCPSCFLVLDSFQQFMNHECWRSYYLVKFHFGEIQAFACRTCSRVFQTQFSYSEHVCDKLTSEEVLPISYRDHFKYFMYWDRRVARESVPYDTDWSYVCRCIKCGNKFKRQILYILHSCFQYSLLNPSEIKCLKICNYCKFVFVNENQYNLHVSYCLRQDRAFCNDFINTSLLRTCQQFVLGRHCYDFDLHITDKPLEESSITKQPLRVGCDQCDCVQESVLEFLYHPCVAGKMITPADLEMIMVCNNCRCLFLNYESCEKHLSYCIGVSFTFLRFNVVELTVALERWITDVMVNPYLPMRPPRMKCQFCMEIFCDLGCILKHLCPKRRRFERCLFPPISLSEMYICDSCSFIYFTSTEAVNHAEKFCSKPLMIQVHPNMAESIIALEVWSKLPRLLQLEIYLGNPGVPEACPKRMNYIDHSADECSNVCI